MSTGTNFYLDLYFGGVEGKLDFGNFWVSFGMSAKKPRAWDWPRCGTTFRVIVAFRAAKGLLSRMSLCNNQEVWR